MARRSVSGARKPNRPTLPILSWMMFVALPLKLLGPQGQLAPNFVTDALERGVGCNRH